MPNWTDAAQAYSAIVSAIIAVFSVPFLAGGIIYAAKTLSAQKQTTDVTNVLEIFERLDHHWCRFRMEKDRLDFEFGQLISYYELSCALFRYGVFTTKVSYVLRDHLHDVLRAMSEQDNFRERFDGLRSEGDTYEHIEWFLKQPARLSASKDCLAIGLQRLYHSAREPS